MNTNGKYITNIAIILLFTTALYAQKEPGGRSINTVVIDPGHGGRDPGALGKVSKEKEIALAISQKLGKLINQRFPEVKVIYTRSDDRFIELYQRAEIANKAKADLFISVHANSSVKQSPSGVEFWVLGLHRADENLEVVKKENAALQFEQDVRKNYGFDPNSPEGSIIMTMQQNLYLDQSIQLAKLMEARFVKEDNQLNRGSKQAGFIVLYKTSMPSVLVEVGFISNPDEEQYISNETGQNKVAANLSLAFADYKLKYESGAIKPVVEEPRKPKSLEIAPLLESNTNAGFSSSMGGGFKIDSDEGAPIAESVKKENTNSASENRPVSSVLDQPQARKKIIIDDDIENYSEVKSTKIDIPPMTNVLPKSPPIDKPTTILKSKSSSPKASVLEAKSDVKKIVTNEEVELPKSKKTISLNSSPLAEKFDNKTVQTDIVKPRATIPTSKDVIKKENIESSLKKMDEPAKPVKPIANTTIPGKIKLEDAANKVPSYLVDGETKKEIVDNTNKIDKKQNILKENGVLEKVNVKPKTPTTDPKSPTTAKSMPVASGIVYRVQLKASSTKKKPYDTESSMGGEVVESFENGLYKYLLGNFSDEKEAQGQLEKVRNQGIKDAFIVKYKEGVRIK